MRAAYYLDFYFGGMDRPYKTVRRKFADAVREIVREFRRPICERARIYLESDSGPVPLDTVTRADADKIATAQEVQSETV